MAFFIFQVHPSGWCVVSRNTSNGDQSEWTCVHDIQDVPTCPTSVSRKRPRDDGETLDRPSTPQATPSRPSRPSSSSGSSSDVHSDEDGLVSTATSAYADSRHGTQVHSSLLLLSVEVFDSILSSLICFSADYFNSSLKLIDITVRPNVGQILIKFIPVAFHEIQLSVIFVIVLILQMN